MQLGAADTKKHGFTGGWFRRFLRRMHAAEWAACFKMYVLCMLCLKFGLVNVVMVAPGGREAVQGGLLAAQEAIRA
jgi:hypothetical protein